MRLAHLSDFHFYAPPDWPGVRTKRVMGLANLHIMGRARHFNPEVAEQAIASVVDEEPDAVVVTGDLTALASPREFVMARDALAPLLYRFPTVIVPGNHDYYTRAAAAGARIEQYFGNYIRTPSTSLDAPVYPSLHVISGVAIIGMNPNRYSLGAAGKVDPAEAERLEALLEHPDVADRFKVLLIHYPLFDRRGETTTSFWRRLDNREMLIDVLMRHRVELVLHGHDHMRYLNHLHIDGQPVTFIYNAGSAAFDRGFDHPIRASHNLYEIEGREFVRVVHKDYSREGFRVSYDGPPSLTRLDAPSGGDEH